MLLFVMFISCGIINFYLGYQQLRLLKKGSLNISKRISLKILNKAIAAETEIDTLKKLRLLKVVYIINIVLISIAIIIAAYGIYSNAVK